MRSSTDYLEALNSFLAADQHLRDLASRLATLSEAILNRPSETCFVDIENEPQPRLDDMIPGARWCAPAFPTAEQLQSALRERLMTRNRATKIFGQLTPAQRKTAPPVSV